MELHDKFRKIVELIYDKTCEGSLAWLSEKDGVYTSIGNSVVWFSSLDGGIYDESFEQVHIRNEANQVIEQFDNTMMGDASPTNVGFDSYRDMMAEIRAMAVRQARGADDALDDILSELEAR